MQVSRQVLQAFDSCFDAVIGLTAWPVALQELGRYLGADSSVLIPCAQDFTKRFRLQIESTEHAGFSDLWVSRLHDPLDDPHSTRARRYAIASSPCVIEHQITSEQERATLPYFNEIARPGERDWWALLRTKTAGGAWGLNLYRGASGGAYGPEEGLRIGAAAPLLRRLAIRGIEFITMNSTLEYAGQALPDMTIVTEHELQLRLHSPETEAAAEEDGRALGRVSAFYDREANRIFLDDPATIEGASLLHELVHFLQNINGTNETFDDHRICLEAEAYDIQSAWQTELGVDLARKPDYGFVMTLYGIWGQQRR